VSGAGQIAWLLFLKIYDDKDQEFELLHDSYRSPKPIRIEEFEPEKKWWGREGEAPAKPKAKA
jgi:hypothetical protein